MQTKFIISALAAVAAQLLLPTEGSAQQPAPVSPQVVEAYVKGTWKSPPEGWQSRIDQDETQKLCSQYRNSPPANIAQNIVAREKATVVFPADGKVLGNWKDGEKVAQTGTGGQFTDPPDAVKGGNCYACHQMAAKELSFGTLGPSLVEYGKIRKYKPEEAKETYAKIFNAQSVQACSNMPRFGYHKFLTEQQMKDVTAYLFDPESPVNKP
ncbi:MAG: sulfur oxidation c-type cytochrome SoxX [Hyphomicrobiales bacterium]|nr:MAG: sulfur oxidation c-type cytochrome SoxX [Hyphomicrobiales bacterium]